MQWASKAKASHTRQSSAHPVQETKQSPRGAGQSQGRGAVCDGAGPHRLPVMQVHGHASRINTTWPRLQALLHAHAGCCQFFRGQGQAGRQSWLEEPVSCPGTQDDLSEGCTIFNIAIDHKYIGLCTEDVMTACTGRMWWVTLLRQHSSSMCAHILLSSHFPTAQTCSIPYGPLQLALPISPAFLLYLKRCAQGCALPALMSPCVADWRNDARAHKDALWLPHHPGRGAKMSQGMTAGSKGSVQIKVPTLALDTHPVAMLASSIGHPRRTMELLIVYLSIRR